MISQAFESVVADFKAPFDRAMKVRNFHIANLIAMEAAQFLFECDSSRARPTLWNQFFFPMGKQYRIQYQSYDFEVADYQLYAIPQSWSLLRGPRPSVRDIANGQYVTFIGAAQLFGRYQHVAPHTIVGNALGVSCLNLSTGGAGPESFIQDESVKLINGGKAVIVQILSGRSIGCEEYPGTRLTVRPQRPDVKVDRLKLLGEIWNESRQEASRLVRKWQRRYLEIMISLLDRIEVPVVLAWISARAPGDWSVDHLETSAAFGAFPQLVDAEMVRELASQCAEFVEVSHDEGLPYGFTSRFTGKKCPVFLPKGLIIWENNYYPSTAVGVEIATKITKALESALGR